MGKKDELEKLARKLNLKIEDLSLSGVKFADFGTRKPISKETRKIVLDLFTEWYISKEGEVIVSKTVGHKAGSSPRILAEKSFIAGFFAREKL